MKLGIVARKCGMTRIFDEDGNGTSVTVLHVDSNFVCQIKSEQTDGYNAIQIAYAQQKPSRVTKSKLSHLAKAGVKPSRGLKEFRVSKDVLESVKLGDQIKVTQFEKDQAVDVTGTSKGHGFTGVIKRWNFSMQDATHGNSLSHRAHGSTGQNQTPGRVFKGKKMAGHEGNTQVTVQNLKLISVDEERECLLVSGSVPGSKGGYVFVNHAVKHANSGSDK